MRVNFKLLPAFVLLAGSMAGQVQAVPSADEIKQLGVTLTPWGAEKAGNADGTIPEYTGGLTKPPANYDPQRPGWRPDPFPEDKPLVRIDAKNMEQYKERLSPGTMEMMKKYPDYYINVFQTRRTAAYPQDVLDNSILNASRCATQNGDLGLDTSKGCGFGIPFPIPKNGLEVMWNHEARYRPTYKSLNSVVSYVKPSGEVVVTARGTNYREWPLYDKRKQVPDTFFAFRMEYSGPARLNGMNTLWHDMTADSERRNWAYQPATRRVRLSPDSAADTPISAAGGAMLYDDDQLFSGKKDRFEWKLVGKREMYIPYNNYRSLYADQGGCTREKRLATSRFMNPECVRWELHRVWHVEATLKEGKRHVYAKRDFFFDEDSFSDGIAENYDKSGNLYRISQQIGAPAYDVPSPSITDNYVIDLISGIYLTMQSDDGYPVVEPLTPAQLSADFLDKRIFK
ncbi:hypothetical protein D9M69_381100 [compost metagenome]